MAVLMALTASPSFADGDAAKGESLLNSRCKACHTFDKDGPNRVGPNLFGVFGAKVGAVEGYRYSDSYTEAGAKGVTWTEENLVKYMADPKGFIAEVTGDPKARSKMTFKLRKEDEREDVTAYLKTLK